MPDYSQGKIYIIHNNINNLKYVGSTTQSLGQRMAKHRENVKHETNKRLYKAFNEHGIENFYIELHHLYDCQTKNELEAEEGKLIRELNTFKNGYNGKISGRTMKEFLKEYYIENKEQMKDEARKNHYKNQEHNNQVTREYYNIHKHEINEKGKIKDVCPQCQKEMRKNSIPRHVRNVHKENI